jgi:predicted deacylase
MDISEQEKKKYETLLRQAQSSLCPVVLVNACTHGHETVGVDVIQKLQNISLEKGVVLYNIANEQAKEKSVDCIETDLNRSFPGNASGTYEEQVAHALHSVVQACDVVIDIHSTNTITTPEDRMLIVTKWDDATRMVAEHIDVSRTIIMEATEQNALISDACIGLGFEFGGNDEKTALFATQQVLRVLAHLHMLSGSFVKEKLASCTVSERSVYRVFDTYPKTDTMQLSETVRNFQQVHAGDIVAYENGTPVYAEKNFVPVLFGDQRYKGMFGFVGEEVA